MTEFIYRYNAPDRAHVFLSFQLETTSRTEEVAAVLDELERGGMKGCDISDDEMAKSHARYMIGGASEVPNERIFRFGEPFLPLFQILPLLSSLLSLIDRFYPFWPPTPLITYTNTPIPKNRRIP